MMPNDKKILILGGGQMQIPIIECANALGMHTVVADMAADAPGLLIAKERLLISTMDMDRIREYCHRHPIDGIRRPSPSG